MDVALEEINNGMPGGEGGATKRNKAKKENRERKKDNIKFRTHNHTQKRCHVIFPRIQLLADQNMHHFESSCQKQNILNFLLP
jgi:hypothetical protein